jgi:thiosulfate dehydrogenase (quinone) large subunit
MAKQRPGLWEATPMIRTLNARFDAVAEQAAAPILGVARIGVGLMWLANIHWKVPGSFGADTGGGLYKYSASVSRHSTFAPFTWLTEEIILPNFRFFGWFTLISEITLAALLLIGYKTRLVALAGAMMAVPIMLSVLYYDKADEWSWSYLLMIFVHLALFAANAGQHLGVDGVLARKASALRALTSIGIVTTVIGVAGLFVSRSVDFASRKAALLGSDAGFIKADGSIARRWELKFLWFNPLWALLTIVCGVLIVVGAKKTVAAWAGSAGLAAMAVAVFVQQRFDYLRDDDSVQKVATGSNVAVWAGLAIATALIVRSALHASRGNDFGTNASAAETA